MDQKNILQLFEDSRYLKFSKQIYRKAIDVITKSNDVTFLFTFKQVRFNAGVLFAFTNGTHRYVFIMFNLINWSIDFFPQLINNRVLEIQSSGRRKELRLYYLINGTVYSETFDVDLADNNWHKLALTISDVQLDLHVDCVHRFRRTILPLDKNSLLNYNNANDNLTLWIGQRGPHHFIYKVIFLFICFNQKKNNKNIFLMNPFDDILFSHRQSIINAINQ